MYGRPVSHQKRTRSGTQQQQQDLQQLSQAIDKPEYSATIWPMLVPLAQQGVVLEQIGMNPGGEFSLKLKASKATQVLESFTKYPQLDNPRFRGEVTQDQELERFTIVFRWKEQQQ